MTPYYHKYDFISPEPIYAKIKEELSSYFLSGALDDTLFGKWTNTVLRKLSRGTLPIRTAFVLIEDGKGTLPEDFKYVREMWALEEYGKKFTDPNVTYATVTAKRIDSPDYRCNPCDTCANREVIQAIYKLTSSVLVQFTRKHKLRPGIIIDTPGFPAMHDPSSVDIFDIDGDLVRTGFQSGVLFLMYYAEEYNENGFQLVPDEVHIEEAIEYYIRFKLAEMLYNMASDESFNQTRVKKSDAEQSYLEKFIMAETWMKKETKEQKRRAVAKQKSRLNKYRYK